MSVYSNNHSIYPCSNSTHYFYITTVFNASRLILLLPVSTLVLYLGHQRWRQQRSFETASHSDFFTYHVAAMELIWTFGILLFGGAHGHNLTLVLVGMYTSSIGYYGELFFNLLACVERYLAVVHPVTFMGLRNARGVRIRNISTGCVWLLGIVLICVAAVLVPNTDNFTIITLCLLVFSIVVVSFCSISVLCVLIRPGPGDGGREKKQLDQSKKRAFLTITAISCMLWLWFVGLLVSTLLSKSPLLSENVSCVVTACVSFLNLPTSLVLPLLFLHRAGKLSCCCNM